MKQSAGFLSAALVAVFVLSDATSGQRRGGGQATAAPGTLSRVVWAPDGKSVEYTTAGERFRFDLETRQKASLGRDAAATRGGGAQRRGRGGRRGGQRRGGQRRGGTQSNVASTGTNVGPAPRGRQYLQVDSPDGQWEAHYQDWNVVLKHKQTGETVQVTTDGNETIHYGTASWVYGEELGQKEAMWWSPDSKKLIYYRFDDTGVEPFHLVTGWTDINTTHYPEFYPKPGAKNPEAALKVYDLAGKTSIDIDAGADYEHYLYAVRVSPDGSTMMVNRTDRLQQDLEVLGIDLETGACRVIVAEHQDTWQTNKPGMRYLADQRRFIWTTDKSGYTHYEIRDLDGNFYNAITSGEIQTTGLQMVDEAANLVSFTANSSSENAYYNQYHMVGLDGAGQRRVTTLELHHSNYNLSPDSKWLIAQYEEVNTPPCTALYSTSGEFVANLAESDPSTAANLAEMFKFRSDDGRFDIYGILYKPRDFDPNKTYPVINTLYGGPNTQDARPTYVSQSRANNNRGYLEVRVNNRGTGGRGKAFLGATYLRLGDVDIQDHADAIRHLRSRPYVDGDRVGIVGSSYGGYMAAMGIFKHPDVYAAAVDKSGPTDWRNYDTIYTERYMSTPQLNKDGYDTGAAMTYVEQFKGKILILHGMLDDNVHPTNAFQLIDAMDRAGKRYESRFFPRSGHGTGRGGTESEIEFFDRVLRPNSN